MKAIAVMNPKGGSGKSTLATNLAGYFASHGSGAMLGDIDRQQSSKAWLNIRPESAPHIATWEVGADSMARPPKGVSHVVLDTPAGLTGKLLEKVIKVAAKIVVPVQASPFDMWAVEAFLQEVMRLKAITKGKADIALVGMRVDTRTRSAETLRQFMAEQEARVLTFLRPTQLYVQAASMGLTLFDLPVSKVHKDLLEWQPLLDWVEQER
jgi:chromosome partitioning protein